MPEQTSAGTLVSSPDKLVAYEIDSDRRLVVTYVGPITFGDIRGIQDLLLQDPAFDASFPVLVDALRCSFDPLSPDELARIGQSTPFVLTSRRAFVVDAALNYGITRMFASLSESRGREFPLGIFDNVADAMRWLAEPSPG
jgi:hypothetical protein